MNKKTKTVLIKLELEDYSKLLKINSYLQEKNIKKESFSETVKTIVNVFYSEKISANS